MPFSPERGELSPPVRSSRAVWWATDGEHEEELPVLSAIAFLADVHLCMKPFATAPLSEHLSAT